MIRLPNSSNQSRLFRLLRRLRLFRYLSTYNRSLFVDLYKISFYSLDNFLYDIYVYLKSQGIWPEVPQLRVLLQMVHDLISFSQRYPLPFHKPKKVKNAFFITCCFIQKGSKNKIRIKSHKLLEEGTTRERCRFALRLHATKENASLEEVT